MGRGGGIVNAGFGAEGTGRRVKVAIDFGSQNVSRPTGTAGVPPAAEPRLVVRWVFAGEIESRVLRWRGMASPLTKRYVRAALIGFAALYGPYFFGAAEIGRDLALAGPGVPLISVVSVFLGL